MALLRLKHQRDMGCSSFNERTAKFKWNYQVRFDLIDKNKWAMMLYRRGMEKQHDGGTGKGM